MKIAVPCVLFLVVSLLCINETTLYSPDSVNYMSWAHSLSRFGGFTDATGPEPEHYVFNAPLYPVLLAPVALAFPLNVTAAKLATLLAGLFMLAAFQVFISRRVSPGAALGAGLFLAVNPLFILYSTQVLSDVPFAACCVLAFALLEKVVPEREQDARGTYLFIAAVCAGLFLREVGIALVAASAFLLLYRGRTRTLLLLLVTVALTYGLWFVRNELIVARAENPGLRNMSLFFSHVYTESGASAAAEVTARIERSAQFYVPAFFSLLSAPFGVAWTYSVTDSSDGVFASVQAFLGTARWVVAFVTFIPVVAGFRRVASGRVFRPFLAVLVPTYALIIAMYPVSDIRFLFPAVLLLLWCAAAGTSALAIWLRGRSGGMAALYALLVILALPNLAWVRNVVMTNVGFRRDPAAYAEAQARIDPYPGELLLIPHRAAEWIAGVSPPGTVVGSKIKASALWLEGRPLVVLNPLLPMEEFDNRIRDYGIRYIVCELQAHQIPDFALQMALSARHRFLPAFAFADTRVYRIEEKSDPHQGSLFPPAGGFGREEARYLQGVYALAYGSPAQAVATFESMESVPGIETSALFYAAVAHEFAMQFDSAGTLFARFRTIPQSAAYLRQAQVHEDIIALLRSAAAEEPGEEKTAKYQDAAMSYWILGYRAQAAKMLREALRLDPGYFAGEVFGAVFSLALGDTAGAREGVRLAERARPTDGLTRSLKSIMSSIDSLPGAAKKGGLEVAIGNEYARMGLYEMGVDEALKALREGEDPGALRLLAEAYTRKQRRAPALAALRRLETASPGDSTARALIRELAGPGE
jgi:tetratricopeptide (TPR) repeat protein